MIPYNPSSFNSNKTILEQILELKRWLQAHPSYEVFYSSEAGNTSQAITSYDLSAVTDPTNMEIGDVVVFHNSTFGVVTSVDTDNNEFGCDPCISLAGPQGPTGPQGISITNVTINASNHLICTLSNGTTIDAGTIQYDTYVDLGSSSSGTLTDEQYAKAELNDTKFLYTAAGSTFIFIKYGETSTNIVFRTIFAMATSPAYTDLWSITINKTTKAYTLTTDKLPIGISNIYSYPYPDGRVLRCNGSGGATWSTIGTDSMIGTSTAGQVMLSDGSYGVSWGSVPAPEGTSVKSTGVTSGKVLTANGSDGAYWEDASGGSFTHYIKINNASGTLSDDDYNKLLYPDSVIFSNSYTLLQKSYENNTKIEFTQTIPETHRTSILTITITKSTKAYVRTSVYPRMNTYNYDSDGATNGQVLTADGSGNASWQNAGGTTLNKYTFSFNTQSVNTRVLNIINNSVSFKIYATSGTGRLYYNVSFAKSNYWSFSTVISEDGNSQYESDVYFSSVLTNKGQKIVVSGGTITQTALTSSITLYIEYWNDTEILS